MDEKKFNEMDRQLKNALSQAPKKEIPSYLLSGFSQSVMDKIQEKRQDAWMKSTRKKGGLIWGVPAFAVILLASALIFRSPIQTQQGQKQISFQSPVATQEAVASSLQREILAMRQLGVWSDEDEKTILNQEELDALILEAANAHQS